MGSPRKIRRSFVRPGHPWQKERIDQENALLKEYGLKNKTEIWKTTSQLRNFANQAKKLIAATTPQAEREKNQLLQRLSKLGLIPKDAKLDNVLTITLKDLLERRLQTLIVRKGLAKTMSQARQFITHEHIALGNKKMTRPSHPITVTEEQTIQFAQTSPVANPEHAARTREVKK
ncbi:30S ribosomal protein S4 [Candidatus Woesearchaeota archaeon]|nr:30S ribosomal protein S4 [Candidatus Woesearchaeota archaeon]